MTTQKVTRHNRYLVMIQAEVPNPAPSEARRKTVFRCYAGTSRGLELKLRRAMREQWDASGYCESLFDAETVYHARIEDRRGYYPYNRAKSVIELGKHIFRRVAGLAEIYMIEAPNGYEFREDVRLDIPSPTPLGDRSASPCTDVSHDADCEFVEHDEYFASCLRDAAAA